MSIDCPGWSTAIEMFPILKMYEIDLIGWWLAFFKNCLKFNKFSNVLWGGGQPLLGRCPKRGYLVSKLIMLIPASAA